jgi:hypothetical protein
MRLGVTPRRSRSASATGVAGQPRPRLRPRAYVARAASKRSAPRCHTRRGTPSRRPAPRRLVGSSLHRRRTEHRNTIRSHEPHMHITCLIAPIRHLGMPRGTDALLQDRPRGNNPLPACRARATIPILQGLPGSTTLFAADRGDAHLGGCIIRHDSPHRYCKSRGNTWSGEPSDSRGMIFCRRLPA